MLFCVLPYFILQKRKRFEILCIFSEGIFVIFIRNTVKPIRLNDHFLYFLNFTLKPDNFYYEFMFRPMMKLDFGVGKWAGWVTQTMSGINVHFYGP